MNEIKKPTYSYSMIRSAYEKIGFNHIMKNLDSTHTTYFFS